MKEQILKLADQRPKDFLKVIKERLDVKKAQAYELQKLQMANDVFKPAINEDVNVIPASSLTKHAEFIRYHLDNLSVVDVPDEYKSDDQLDDEDDQDDDLSLFDDEDLEEFVTEEDLKQIKHIALNEDVITTLSNMIAKKTDKVSLKFFNGQSISVAYDEAKIILDTFGKLPSPLKDKFNTMLNKNAQSFMHAYNLAMK